MNIHTTAKATTTNATTRQCPSQSIKNNTNIKKQAHKIHPLYETPFNDDVTNQYVRGYN